MKNIALAITTLLISCLAPAWAQQHQHATPPAALAPPEIAQAQVPVPPLPRPTGSGTRRGDMHAPTIFTLRTGIAEGRMVYLGVGGDIDGKVNPTLMVHEGETGADQPDQRRRRRARHRGRPVRRTLATGWLARAASSTMSFTADRTGEFIYFCSVAGPSSGGDGGPHPGRAWAASSRRLRQPHRTSFAIRPICRARSAQRAPAGASGSIWKQSSWSASWTTARPTPTGLSTARCPGPFCACASAIPSRCT